MKASRALLVLTVVFAAAAGATTVVELSDYDMTQQASLIVIGTVEDSRIQWVDRALVTVFTVRVQETLKGSASGTISVTLPGGIDTNRKFPIAMSYPGAPQLGSGESVFLFLVADDMVPGSHAIVGFSQGKFTIEEAAGGTRVMARSMRGLVNPEGRPLASGVAIKDLDEFKARIQSYLRSDR